jgi:hypothetical protein
MQYDFNLAANAGQNNEIVGSFVKYVAGVGLIRVRLSTGQFIDLLPGQSIKGVSFTSVNVSDRSGLPNSGSFLAGNYEFADDTISGTLSTINNSKQDTLLGKGFVSGAFATQSGVDCNGVILANPVGNTKNVTVKKLVWQIANGGGAMIFYNMLLTPAGSVKAGNKLSGGALSTAVISAESRTVVQISVLGAPHAYVPAVTGVPGALALDEPIVIRPGYGLIGIIATANGGGSVGATGALAFEWREDAI